MKIQSYLPSPLVAIQSEKQSHYQQNIQNLLTKILPSTFFQEALNKEEKEGLLQEMTPYLQWEERKGEKGFGISVVLFCKYRLGASNFFYDMMSRWLIPFKHLNIDLFFSADFSLSEITEAPFTIAEVGIYLEEEKELIQAKENWKILETELKLGVVSSYHASRILEFKSLSSDGKTAMIQEKIGSLIQGGSRDFDPSIFSQMQRFLVNCQDEFKMIRDYHHISRIISIFYLIRKMLLQKGSLIPQERHIVLKFLKTKLYPPGEEKQVLGILVGFNLLGEYERFEQSHLIHAIQQHFPAVVPVEGSFMIDQGTDRKIQILYIEIQKQEGSDFSLEEIQTLRLHLPDQLKSSIERLMHPLFMPRNEEEILRNIMALSHQLKYINDLPQVIISFEEQKQEELNFTVIFLRILKPKDLPAAKILEALPSTYKVRVDRTRKLGTLRRKYAKEAVVFRLSLSSKKFFRKDHSIDLYKARQEVLALLQPLFGEIRDYNGGMIHKESQLLSALKATLGSLAKKHELLLDKFFFSLFPVEMRSVLEVEPLKQMFLLLLQGIKKEKSYHSTPFLFKEEAKRAFALIGVDSLAQKKQLAISIEGIQLPSYQLVSFSLDNYKVQGYILLSENKEKQRLFFHTLERALDF